MGEVKTVADLSDEKLHGKEPPMLFHNRPEKALTSHTITALLLKSPLTYPVVPLPPNISILEASQPSIPGLSGGKTTLMPSYQMQNKHVTTFYPQANDSTNK